MNDRYKPTAYEFKADGIKANIEAIYDYWKVYFTRATTSEDEGYIDHIEKMEWPSHSAAVDAIEHMISKRNN